MSWLRRRLGGRKQGAAAGDSRGLSVPSADGEAAIDQAAGPLILCLTCGTPLGFDDEDEPTGDAGGPICGECNRARNFDVMVGR